MNKTQEKISKKYTKLRAEIVMLQGKIEVVRAHMSVLQKQCLHPNKWTKSYYDGSTAEKCDDCGWSWG